MENLQIPTTIGMKIDSVIAKIDNLPYTYQAFAVVCCLFAFLVLNCNNPTANHTYATKATAPLKHHETQQQHVIVKKNRTTESSESSSSSTKHNEDEPQPKWHILKMLNILSVIGLLSSFVWFASTNAASTYLNGSNHDASTMSASHGVLLKFMALWSLLLCYFFGFFGISFVDADELERGSSGVGVVDNGTGTGTGTDTGTVGNTKCGSNLKDIKQVKQVPSIHPPATFTQPLCSDKCIKTQPKSTQSSSSSTTSSDISSLTDNEIANLVLSNKVKDHTLEKLTTPHRAVTIRRQIYETKLQSLNQYNALTDLPYQHDLDYSRVYGANCETVIGYIPLPVGICGPITINDETIYFPMATTEGCLVASTNRGCKAITQGSGVSSVITRDGITRAPCVRLKSAKDAAMLKIWCEERENFEKLKAAFESTTSFGKLEGLGVTVAGRNVYLRLRCFSGDAMGMNMVSKGSLAVIEFLKAQFPSLVLVALSGNMCTDKKAAAINWIEGRGKSVVVEATIPKDVVRSTLKTDVKTIVSVNINKNLIGSAMAGAVGGFNAHASNIVTAVFLATGQDPAQNVESSNCITLMEETEDGDLWISCTMPSIEVGTVGGGTGLPAQSAGLKIIGCKGGGDRPGDNAKKLAHVVASAVMAGELSLLSALAANTLVQAHMQHNRKPASK